MSTKPCTVKRGSQITIWRKLGRAHKLDCWGHWSSISVAVIWRSALQWGLFGHNVFISVTCDIGVLSGRFVPAGRGMWRHSTVPMWSEQSQTDWRQDLSGGRRLNWTSWGLAAWAEVWRIPYDQLRSTDPPDNFFLATPYKRALPLFSFFGIRHDTLPRALPAVAAFQDKIFFFCCSLGKHITGFCCN